MQLFSLASDRRKSCSIFYLLVLDGAVSGSARGRGLGGSESVARCDDVTEMITVEGKYSHADAVCVGMIESRCKKHRVAGTVPGVDGYGGCCPEGKIKSVWWKSERTGVFRLKSDRYVRKYG